MNDKKFIFGTEGEDTIKGLSDARVIFGLGGNDTIYSGKGGDVAFGGAGDDTIYGNRGADVLIGDAGSDSLWGGRGADVIFGGADNDTIEGGKGGDILSGGDGADRFVFNPARKGEGADRITDFTLGEDKIVLSVANVLKSTPGLLALSGDPAAFEPTDLDASKLWKLSASSDGDLLVSHPTGSIEIDGLKFAEGLKFADILPAIDLIA